MKDYTQEDLEYIQFECVECGDETKTMSKLYEVYGPLCPGCIYCLDEYLKNLSYAN